MKYRSEINISREDFDRINRLLEEDEDECRMCELNEEEKRRMKVYEIMREVNDEYGGICGISPTRVQFEKYIYREFTDGNIDVETYKELSEMAWMYPEEEN